MNEDKFKGTITLNIFLPCFLFSFWDSNYMHIRLILSHSSWVLYSVLFCFLTHSLFFSWVSVCVVSIDLSSNWLILSLAVWNLLMSPLKAFVISATVFFILAFPFDSSLWFIPLYRNYSSHHAYFPPFPLWRRACESVYNPPLSVFPGVLYFLSA